jgi:Tol biopolymer transport system component
MSALAHFAISPDGRWLAYSMRGTPGEMAAIWVREMNSLELRRLTGTEAGLQIFWSPDSRSICFFTPPDRALKTVSVTGGPVNPLAVFVDAPRGGAWGRDGTILFAMGNTGPLMAVSASGGQAREVTRFS